MEDKEVKIWDNIKRWEYDNASEEIVFYDLQDIVLARTKLNLIVGVYIDKLQGGCD